MVAGRRFWIAIWYGILFLGVLGLWSSLYWGRQTHWKTSDELLRALGTITVSVGMLLLLNNVATLLGQVLLVLSLVCFLIAFIVGRNAPPPPSHHNADEDADDEAPPERQA